MNRERREKWLEGFVAVLRHTSQKLPCLLFLLLFLFLFFCLSSSAGVAEPGTRGTAERAEWDDGG